MNRHSALILHAHVPWVRHGDTPRCLEEDWLFEAILETYVPVLDVLYRLREEEVPYRLTLNLTPTLLGMLGDQMMKDRASAYLARTAKLAASEAERSNDPAYRQMAQWYVERFRLLTELYENRWQRDLIAAFKDLSETGHLEITASAATHGLLPLLLKVPEAAQAQIQTGADEFERHFGSRAAGFWLPECAYAPPAAPLLKEAGIRWTLLEEHALTSGGHGKNRGPFHPVETGNGLVVFGRDIDSSKQVWSAESGYPGDPRYREFFKDVGLDAPMEALAEYLEGSEIRRFTGLKFHRVTGKTDDKLLYDPALAGRAAAEHAVHFVESRAAQLAELESRGNDHPIVVTAFDAELFGHWWFEGPTFLEQVLRIAAGRDDFQFTTPSQYLDATESKTLSPLEPIASSWGEGGYFETWLSEENAWIYPHLHRRGEQLIRAVRVLKENFDGLPNRLAEHRARCVSQMTRELMQAQASDWSFLMRNGAARPYATKRTEGHLERFDQLWAAFASNAEAAGEKLAEIENSDPIFPEMPWERYAPLA